MACRIADASQATRPVEWRRSITEQQQPIIETAGESRKPESDVARQLSELERARQQDSARARQEGFEQGLLQGREQNASEMKSAAARLAHLLEELVALKRKMRKEVEVEAVKLSLAISRRILYRELTTDPDSIGGIVHAALEKLGRREIIRVRVHPDAVHSVRASLEQAGNSAAINVVADRTLTPGSLIFETAMGELDASIDTQLQEIQRGFTDRLALP
jgi:flagellar assembly protein FliH